MCVWLTSGIPQHASRRLDVGARIARCQRTPARHPGHNHRRYGAQRTAKYGSSSSRDHRHLNALSGKGKSTPRIAPRRAPGGVRFWASKKTGHQETGNRGIRDAPPGARWVGAEGSPSTRRERRAHRAGWQYRNHPKLGILKYCVLSPDCQCTGARRGGFIPPRRRIARLVRYREGGGVSG